MSAVFTSQGKVVGPVTLTQSGASSTRGYRHRHLPTICCRLYSRTATGRIPTESNTQTCADDNFFLFFFSRNFSSVRSGSTVLLPHQTPFLTSSTHAPAVLYQFLITSDGIYFRSFIFPFLFDPFASTFALLNECFFVTRPNRFDSMSHYRPLPAIETPPPFTL